MLLVRKVSVDTNNPVRSLLNKFDLYYSIGNISESKNLKLLLIKPNYFVLTFLTLANDL